MLLAVGCQPPKAPEIPQPDLAQLDPVVADPAVGKAMAGLKATLGRFSIELDEGPKVDLCAGESNPKCVVCDVVVEGADPDLIDEVGIAMSLYPPKLLAATGIQRVAVCRRFHTTDSPVPAGLANLSGHRLLINLDGWVEGRDGNSVAEVVHHEVFHFFDWELLHENATADAEWHALNPRGFAYQDAAGVIRPDGFVDAYASTAEMEDRASTYEYVMARSKQLCEIAAADPVVANKVGVVWARIAAVAGPRFLRAHAACAEHLAHKGPVKRKPPPVKHPKLREAVEFYPPTMH
jgi:hypothetical protein